MEYCIPTFIPILRKSKSSLLKKINLIFFFFTWRICENEKRFSLYRKILWSHKSWFPPLRLWKIYVQGVKSRVFRMMQRNQSGENCSQYRLDMSPTWMHESPKRALNLYLWSSLGTEEFVVHCGFYKTPSFGEKEFIYSPLKKSRNSLNEENFNVIFLGKKS